MADFKHAPVVSWLKDPSIIQSQINWGAISHMSTQDTNSAKKRRK